MSVMSFEKFQYIIRKIQAYEAKKNRISDFIEKELCTDSYCFFNVGEDIEDTLICMLADEFNCWYTYTSVNEGLKKDQSDLFEATQGVLTINNVKKDSSSSIWWDKSFKRWENDIEYWLYEDHKKIEINDKEIPIKTLRQFYNYLIKYCVDKN